MQEFIDLINSFVWSPALVYLLLAAGRAHALASDHRKSAAS